MPWEPPRAHKFNYHHTILSPEFHTHTMRTIGRVFLLSILALGLWFTVRSMTTSQYCSDSIGPIYPPSRESTLESKSSHKSVVGKVHAVFGEPNPMYERALRLHEVHAKQNGHPMFVLRRRLLSGLWSKPAFILSIILQELEKPKEIQLKWLMWTDADVVIMNLQMSLDIFIPPSPDFDWVNIVYTQDRHGLNNGVFLLKVNAWSVKLLSGVIAFHNFRPDRMLIFSEQSSLEELIIKDPYWAKNAVEVPQHWFNSYPARTKEHPKVHEFRAGGYQVHLVSNRDGKRPQRMKAWLDIAEQQLPKYNLPVENTTLIKYMQRYWASLSEGRREAGALGITREKEEGLTNHNVITDPW